MNRRFAITKDVVRAKYVVTTLTGNRHNIECMGCISGINGSGKSTTIDYLIDQFDGIAMRAMTGWTPVWMLSTLCAELRIPEKIRKSNRRQTMSEAIVEHLNERPRPIFIDEVDRLFNTHNHRNGYEIIESLRDIYDTVKLPVIFVGEEGSAIAIQESGHFARRITQWIEFKGLDRDDARVVADTVCEVRVADDLLDHLYEESGANVGRMIVGIDAIERHGKAAGLDEVSRAAWGDKALFFDQPGFARKARRS